MNDDMKRIGVTLLFFLACKLLFSQNLINHTASEVKTIMKAEYKDFRLSTTTKNPSYRYLKYENYLRTETLLFFLSDDEVCTYCKYLGDYACYNSRIGELNEKHRKISENAWIEELKGEKYRIELEKGEWFFTLTTRKIESNQRD
jgi:hypothetical protein